MIHVQIYFEKNTLNNQIRGDNRIIKIDLYYNMISRLEEKPSFLKLLLDILNIQSILFNLNIFKLITIIFSIKLKRSLIYLLIIYFFYYFGFILHSYFIFKEIIFNKLVCSQFYEKSKSVDFSEIIFCVNFNQELIDENYKLTFNYLDKITNKINIRLIFQKIDYLNPNNEWSSYFGNQSFNYDKFNEEKLIIDTFYFLGKKCFKLSINTINLMYNQTQLHFLEKKDMLKILFNKSFSKSEDLIYFLTKNTMQFSKILNFEFPLRSLIKIRQSRFFIGYNDKFIFIDLKRRSYYL